MTPRPTATVTPTPSPLDNIGAGMIAFVSDRDGDDEIYLMSLPGAPGDELTLYQLTNNTHDEAVPDWSPDGTQMAFASTRDGNWEIYVMDVAPDPQGAGADGVNVRRLTNHEGEDTLPAWSPDGSQIAFASKRDGDWEIYVMDKDGTNLHRLTHNPDIDMKPSWSPDGSQIVFDSGAGYERHIFVMDVADALQSTDGSNQRLVAHAGGGWPDWSPNGTQIAYFGRLDGNPEIYVVNATGTDQRRLTRNSTDDWEPSWSPDGEWLLFVSGQTTDIFAMRADGSETRRLTHDRHANWSPVWRPSTSAAPSWSSSGGMIAFLSNRAAGNYEVYVMPAPGQADGEPRRLATADDGFCVGPSWSPDGQRVAYARIVPNERGWLGNHGPFEVWAATLDGAESTLLNTDIISDITAFPWPTPSWSPDGTRLAFVATRETDERRRAAAPQFRRARQFQRTCVVR